MRKSLSVSVTAGLVFAVSAGASWVWRVAGPRSEPAAMQHTDRKIAAPKMANPAATAQNQASRGSARGSAADSGGEQETARTAPAARPASAPGTEVAMRLAEDLRERMASMREREAELATRQAQLDLVYEDIRSERGSLDELRKQISEELKALDEQLAAIEGKHAELQREQEGMETRITELEGDERVNVKKMAAMFDSMAPESAAVIVAQMADSGKMDTAVKLLGLMKERQAAKVLAALPEPSLAAQLSEKLKGLKRPTTTVPRPASSPPPPRTK